MASKQQFPKHVFSLPVGRLISGSLTELQTKDYSGKPREHPVYWFGVAVHKQQPGVDAALAIIYGCGVNDYQHSAKVQAEAKQWLGARNFAWKIHDGDTSERWKGREGADGCYIFGMQTMYEIRCCDANNVQMDPASIGLGDYIDLAANVAINGLTDDNAGVFLNPEGVRFIQTGKRIVVGKAFGEMFKAPPAAAPVGGFVAPGAAGPAGGPPATGMTPPGHGAPITPPPTQPPASAPAVPAGAVPGPAALPAPSTPQPGFAANASPGSLPAPPAGVVPHVGILQPQAPPPPVETAAQVAARFGVTHYPGHRYDQASNSYVPDPTSV